MSTTHAAPSPIDSESAVSESFATGSKAIAAVGEPLVAVLDRTGWRRDTVVTEPDGSPSFVVFERP